MDNTSRAKFDEILRKEPAALTPGDREFLRARKSYLTVDQQKAYAEVLEVSEPDEDPVEPEASAEEKPKKKGK
jgi:RNA binding exosome subunit